MNRATIVLAAALLAATSVSAFGQTTAEKNECLLASRNCTEQVDDIFKRMQKLDREIQKGTRVYSPDELKRLRQKLTETQELLRNMEKPGN